MCVFFFFKDNTTTKTYSHRATSHKRTSSGGQHWLSSGHAPGRGRHYAQKVDLPWHIDCSWRGPGSKPNISNSSFLWKEIWRWRSQAKSVLYPVSGESPQHGTWEEAGGRREQQLESGVCPSSCENPIPSTSSATFSGIAVCFFLLWRLALIIRQCQPVTLKLDSAHPVKRMETQETLDIKQTWFDDKKGTGVVGALKGVWPGTWGTGPQWGAERREHHGDGGALKSTWLIFFSPQISPSTKTEELPLKEKDR